MNISTAAAVHNAATKKPSPLQRRFSPKAVRRCLVCSSSSELLSITSLLYAKHSKVTASQRVLICEPCAVAAMLDLTQTSRRRKLSDALLAELLRIYKTVRGVE